MLKQHVGVGSITSDTEETRNKIQEVEIDDPGREVGRDLKLKYSLRYHRTTCGDVKQSRNRHRYRNTHTYTHTRQSRSTGLIQTESWVKRKQADLNKHTLAAVDHLKQTCGSDTLPLPQFMRVHTHTPSSTSELTRRYARQPM